MRLEPKLFALVQFGFLVLGVATDAQQPAPLPKAERPVAQPQPRESGKRVAVDPATLTVDDGDTISIHWNDNDVEIVRILGIDTPETRHVAHKIPIDQPFGREARAFAQGVFSLATKIEILRCVTIDPYGRTLGYIYVNDQNYSLLIIKAGLAEESVTHYGDNGFPDQAKAVLEAAKAVGPVPFEPPHLFRTRMRKVVEAGLASPALTGD